MFKRRGLVYIPDLYGSEKQIAYGTELRAKLLPSWIQYACEQEEVLGFPFLQALGIVLDWHAGAKFWIEYDEEKFHQLVGEIQLLSFELAEQRKSPHPPCSLLLLDVDNTVSTTPFRDQGKARTIFKDVLPILALYGQKALVTNQGGVAFGLATEEEVHQQLRKISEALGIASYQVSFAHPTPKAGYEHYGTPEGLAFRKPAPGMLLHAMELFGIPSEETLMVGDMLEDHDAAQNAGCQFRWAQVFFGRIP